MVIVEVVLVFEMASFHRLIFKYGRSDSKGVFFCYFVKVTLKKIWKAGPKQCVSPGGVRVREVFLE